MRAAVALSEDVVAVLDTAPLIYYVGGRADRLGLAARRLLHTAERRGRRVGASTISLFEIARLEERGRVQLSLPFDRWCQLVEDSQSLLVLALERPHVSEARALPALRDPFDRLIAGSAAALGVPLITSDARIAESRRVRVVW
jgi:PIN domain nuclease of toxin-antitoxin system